MGQSILFGTNIAWHPSPQLTFLEQLDLSAFLREQQNTIGWCTVFLGTVSKTAPAIAMADEPLERERHHWWKAKKWAYFNLNRLYIR